MRADGQWRVSPAVPLLLLVLALGAASATQVNDTAISSSEDGEGSTWATETVPAGSEQDLLKWALAHSDPDELRQAARQARMEADAGTPEFKARQQRVQQLIEAMKSEPTEAELMQEAVAILSNSSATPQQLANALEALRYLVEPVDNANNLQGMAGLAPLVALLDRQHPPHLNAAAAYTLGTAASNNHEFLGQLLGDHPEALSLLLQLLNAGNGSAGTASTAAGTCTGKEDGKCRSTEASTEEQAAAAAAAEAGVKALYCLSNILRLSEDARTAFYKAGGVQTLQVALRSGRASAQLKRKALGLLTDLIHLDSDAMDAAAAARAQQAQQAGKKQGSKAKGKAAEEAAAAAEQEVVAPKAAGLDYPAAVAAALQLLDVDQQQLAGQEQDLDLQEKALLVLLALLENGKPAAELIAESGGMSTLARLQASLKKAAAAEGEDGGDYLHEIAGLAWQVQVYVRAAVPDAAGASEGTCLNAGAAAASHDSSEL